MSSEAEARAQVSDITGQMEDTASQQTSAEVITGSCLCKKVTYTVTGAPLFNTICHCYNCRKAGGGSIQSSSVYMTTQIQVSGAEHLTTYADTAVDSGTHFIRRFCSSCGSPVLGQSPMAEQFTAVNAGSLDEGFVNEWKPSVEQYLQTKAGFMPRLVGEGEGARFVRSMVGEKVE
ncbi:Mss4-like protein [Elsinoe ampelina]|uniref:Mss4-like protein n=1 Tax=Elsinoe ampelina TaxID=302913 RepID=A0A6A6GHC6_9PEZI|nr:Mss4-like protein [Elsinoe ampelina]